MTLGTAPSLNRNPADAAAYFRTMLTIRLFEEQVTALHAAGEVLGSVHLCSGQEAIPAGTVAALGESDAVFATYRGHGWAIALGVPLEQLFAEMLGRAGGINGGRGGSAYLTAPAHRLYGENAIVGAQTALALGPALAARFDGSGRVSVASLGDGAMNQGATNEALNFAAALRLPVLFVCENNGWSELTPTASMVGNTDLTARARAFGVSSRTIDGNDPFAVGAAVAEAASEARAGKGPVFIEAMTERIVGHYIGDVQKYRSTEDFARLAAGDPLNRIRPELGPGSLTLAERDVEKQLEVALHRARSQPPADVSLIGADLYA